MPRRQITTYAQRTKTLQKKAKELAILCDVPVALVCAPAPGVRAGTRLVWESKEGVLDRYRAAAVLPDTRARHTHRSYLEAELGKERAKLARVRQRGCPGALADWDAELNDMTLDEGRRVLETIDAALRAASDRMVALGLPADGEQVALAPDDDASEPDDAGVPQQLGLEDASFQRQMPGYGFECVGGNDVGAVHETQVPGSYGDNADCVWPDLTMYCANDGSCLPAGYYCPKFVDSTLAPEHYSAQVVTGGDYIDTQPLQHPMGMDENFTYVDNSYRAQWQAGEFQRFDTNSSMGENYTYLDNSYAAHWQAEEFQRSDTSTGQYQYQCSDPGTRSSSQVFYHGY
ncbi:unnamed protein product [Alopecurus aequalis]